MMVECAIMPAQAAPVGALVLYPPKARQDQAIYRVVSHHPDGMAAQDKDNPKCWLIMANVAPVAVIKSQRPQPFNPFGGTSNTSSGTWSFG